MLLAFGTRETLSFRDLSAWLRDRLDIVGLRWKQAGGCLVGGTAMGFGTIPVCTGCDHDDFIDPDADIAISFERLGTLRCRFAEPAGKLVASRWPVRPQMQKYHI